MQVPEFFFGILIFASKHGSSKGALRRLNSRMLTACAERGEMMRRNGCIPPPPQFELVDYPGIFFKINFLVGVG